MLAPTDYKKLAEDALQSSNEHTDLYYIQELARAVLALNEAITTLLEDCKRHREEYAKVFNERTQAYSDLTIANLEVRNLRERLAGGKLD